MTAPPTRPAPGPPPAVPAASWAPGPVLPVTYVPEPYLGSGADWAAPAPSPYPLGVIHPAPSRRGLWVAIALIVAIAVATAGYLYFSRDGRTEAAVPAGSGVSGPVPTAAPPGPGVAYRSDAGHFLARFARRPAEQAAARSIAGIAITVHVAADPSAATLIEGADISPELPRSGVDAFLRGEIVGIGNSGALTVTDQHASTFQGRPAREAQYTAKNGTALTALCVVYGTGRSYVLLAPSAAFDALEASFVALP